ncbi:MAG: DUF4167 domain-containing protein [Hyphomicrobiales bacterium]|nr:MAG: DUF4167 domain-containing protein [Hyphomicrobiales bacterium]
MRPNQNNKNRSRGRNNNGGRKHINPLSRNFESNGPDVKVRGNAAHIAEKYLQLARDAQSSGDSVMAENYLQHAEHYFRIVAAAQPQNRDQGGQVAEVEDFDDDFPPMNDRFASPEPRQPFPQSPQPDQQQPTQQQQPAMPDADNGETVVIQAVPVESAEAQADGEARRHRDRRPRRRSRGTGEGGPAGEGGADPGASPQPDIGLPAFLTAGGSAAE